MARKRVTELLVQQEYFCDAQEASRAILAGEVFLGDASHKKILKPGETVPEDSLFNVKTLKEYVSRGGEKLKGALSSFAYDMTNKRVVDVGSSTGGFTDCSLQSGAQSVAAIDVGYGQLAWKLRTDPRVTVFERTNVRKVTSADVSGPFDVAVADLSFIPLERVLQPMMNLLTDTGDLVILVKPQFEAAKSEIGQKGVVENIDTHARILHDVVQEFMSYDLKVHDVAYSPIKGPEGNIEFWIYASKVERGACAQQQDFSQRVHEVVENAHAALR